MYTRTILIATAIVATLSGCNAARGLGQDVENLGRLMQGKDIDSTSAAQQSSTVVSETVTYGPPPSEVTTDSAGVETMPLPSEGQVQVYPYPNTSDQNAQPVYPAPQDSKNKQK